MSFPIKNLPEIKGAFASMDDNISLPLVSDLKLAMLQRFLLRMFYPPIYFRYLFHEYFKVTDEDERRKMMSIPVDLNMEGYMERPTIVFKSIPVHVKRFIWRCISVDQRKMLFYINFRGDLSTIHQNEKSLNFHDILVRILPRFIDPGKHIYKRIDPIWISEADDIFTVYKPYTYVPDSSESDGGGFTASKTLLGSPPGRLNDEPLYILKLTTPNFMVMSGYDRFDRVTRLHMFKKGTTISIDSVTINQYGHIILSGSFLSNSSEDNSSHGVGGGGGGGGSYSTKRRVPLSNNVLLLSSTKALQKSPSTATTTSVTMLLSFAIIAIASIFPR